MKNSRKALSLNRWNLFVFILLIAGCLLLISERTRHAKEKQNLNGVISETNEGAGVSKGLAVVEGRVQVYRIMGADCKLDDNAKQDRLANLKNSLYCLEACEFSARSGRRRTAIYNQHYSILKNAMFIIELLEANHDDLCEDSNFKELHSFIRKMKSNKELLDFMKTFSEPPFQHKGLGYYQEFLRRQSDVFDAWKEKR